MSCTIIAIPAALYWAIGAIATAGAVCSTLPKNNFKHETQNTCEDIHIITDNHFIEKSFETPFMDKSILLKTLEEHGVVDIKENEYGKITGNFDNYTLAFEKSENEKPYYLKITCLETDNAEEKVNDLNSEYALNTQEEVYLNIVEKLKEHNMQIENEEVCDDNTIVLTINLD